MKKPIVLIFLTFFVSICQAGDFDLDTGTIGTIDHGELNGLSDDDHPQYLELDGSDTMTGNLILNGGWISGDGDDEGISVDADGDVTLSNYLWMPDAGIIYLYGPSSYMKYNELRSNSSSGLTLNASNSEAGLYLKTAGTTRCFLDKLGSVGIGTTSPDALFHVVKPTTETAAAVEAKRTSLITSGTPMAGLALRHNLEMEAQEGNNEIGGFYQLRLTNAAAGGEYFALDFGLMSGGSAATTKMTLLGTGYLGLGTTSPTSRLHVSANTATGSYAATVVNSGDSGEWIQFINDQGTQIGSFLQTTAGDGYWTVSSESNPSTCGIILSTAVGINESRFFGNDLFMGAAKSTAAFFFDASEDRVGIGTNAPDGPLTVRLGTNDGSDSVNFEDSDGITVFEINSDGKVSIRVDPPVYADNSAAISGGLSTGDIYRTSTGALMIVYTP